MGAPKLDHRYGSDSVLHWVLLPPIADLVPVGMNLWHAMPTAHHMPSGLMTLSAKAHHDLQVFDVYNWLNPRLSLPAPVVLAASCVGSCLHKTVLLDPNGVWGFNVSNNGTITGYFAIDFTLYPAGSPGIPFCPGPPAASCRLMHICRASSLLESRAAHEASTWQLHCGQRCALQPVRCLPPHHEALCYARPPARSLSHPHLTPARWVV